ncbi:MAG: DUF167 domain-containing protein [Terriglobia bacterium]
MSLRVESRGGGAQFRVKVQARARREQIAGVHDGRLRVRVAAPPLEGRANRAVLALLAKHLRVPKSSIKIAAGERSPAKLIHVAGLDAAAVLQRLRLGPPGGSE